ncbi:hypothetical protein [Roseomonas elaeocarpi]|uniref:Uncharacterized protein n=1 Tax=Roseomonas elaeocarpi TaxID=907779 RepID=A0ABV6JWM5_9PROT
MSQDEQASQERAETWEERKRAFELALVGGDADSPPLPGMRNTTQELMNALWGTHLQLTQVHEEFFSARYGTDIPDILRPFFPGAPQPKDGKITTAEAEAIGSALDEIFAKRPPDLVERYQRLGAQMTSLQREFSILTRAKFVNLPEETLRLCWERTRNPIFVWLALRRAILITPGRAVGRTVEVETLIPGWCAEYLLQASFGIVDLSEGQNPFRSASDREEPWQFARNFTRLGRLLDDAPKASKPNPMDSMLALLGFTGDAGWNAFTAYAAEVSKISAWFTFEILKATGTKSKDALSLLMEEFQVSDPSHMRRKIREGQRLVAPLVAKPAAAGEQRGSRQDGRGEAEEEVGE